MDADLAARRELAKLLQVEVIIRREFVDVSCVLGRQKIATKHILAR